MLKLLMDTIVIEPVIEREAEALIPIDLGRDENLIATQIPDEILTLDSAAELLREFRTKLGSGLCLTKEEIDIALVKFDRYYNSIHIENDPSSMYNAQRIKDAFF